MIFGSSICIVVSSSLSNIDNLIFAGGIQKISQALMNFHSRNLEEINISSRFGGSM